MKLFLSLAATIGTVQLATCADKKSWTEAECRDFVREIGRRWEASAKKEIPAKIAGDKKLERLWKSHPPAGKGDMPKETQKELILGGLNEWVWSRSIVIAIDDPDCKELARLVWDRCPSMREPSEYVGLILMVGGQSKEVRELALDAA